jgi:hypothetical protein
VRIPAHPLAGSLRSGAASLRPAVDALDRQHRAAQAQIVLRSINVASSAGAFELFTRFDTRHL